MPVYTRELIQKVLNAAANIRKDSRLAKLFGDAAAHLAASAMKSAFQGILRAIAAEVMWLRGMNSFFVQNPSHVL